MEEKELEVVIKLDPATDGLRNLTEVICVNGVKSGLVVGTNGKYKHVADKYIDHLFDKMEHRDWDRFGDLEIHYDSRRTFWVGEQRYLVGSMIVLQKDVYDCYIPFTDDQIAYVMSDIRRNFVKLKSGNVTFNGFKLND